ncbi:hypothetical protein KSS87_016437, partial [Heliosperma pusillum]
MDTPSQASSLLTKLETYDFAQIDTLYSSLLHPFLNPNQKPPISKKPSSSSTSSTSISVHLQRARFVHCLLRWEKYDKGFDEGIRVLNQLGKVELEGFRFRVSISSGEFVPKVVECVDCDSDSDGDEFVRLVVDLVVVVAQCCDYLDNLIARWHMDASAASKLQWKLLAHMKNVTNFLIREVKYFGEDLISRFCEATFHEYTQLLNARCLQDRMREELEEFVLFLNSYALKCRSACKKLQCTVAIHLHKSASKFSQGLLYISLVQRLYAIGLNLSQFGVAKGTINASSELLPEGWDKLQDLSCILESGKNYYNSNSEADLSFYLNALKFLCAPLAQFINSERKRIVKENIEPSFGKAVKLIQVAFVEYCYLFPLCQEKGGCREEIDMVVLSISMASFTLSLRLFRNTKGCKTLVNHILSDKFLLMLQPQMLNYLVCMLHNLFVDFYRYERLKEASKAGKFCCRVSWSRCIFLCERVVGRSKDSDEEISDSMIADYVNEACKDNSLLIDILYQIDSSKVDNVNLSGLEKWCHCRNLLQWLLCPKALMKRWVKVVILYIFPFVIAMKSTLLTTYPPLAFQIQCKLYANTNSKAPILGSRLLVSSYIKNQNVSPETIGIILEQELVLYQELSCFYPGFCQEMQMAIIGILLQNVYLLNNCLERSIILAKKGFLLRNLEIGGLKSCIDCLSEAINSIDGLSGMIQEKATSVSNQLAILYCLRAMSTQEAKPSSEEIFTDISKAVRIWLRSDAPCHFPNSKGEEGCVYILQLLYHTVDLLSIKGDMALHSDIFSVILKVLKQMNVPLDKCLALLWESRRVNHSLCEIPVSEAFIVALSNIYGKEAESFEFWLNCLKDSQTLSVVFKQNFSFLSSFAPLSFHQHKSFLQSGISVDEVKQVASDLVSMVSESSSSAFLAGHTCYDLSERLSASGKMIEALLYAKEAHRIRSKMLQEHFSFKYELHGHDEGTQKSSNGISQLRVLSQVAIMPWPNHTNSVEKYDGILLTPWNVLSCFLESSLQVGILHETLGNVAEAEALFLVGKRKVYRGKCLLDLAHKELRAAQEVLAADSFFGTCSRCSLVLESKLNEELGHLCRKGVFSAAVNPYESSLRSLISLETGDLTVWFEERDSGKHVLGSKNLKGADVGTSNDKPTLAVKNQKTKIRAEAKKSSKPTKELASQATVKPCVAVQNLRVTRSRKQSSRSNEVEMVEGIHSVSNLYSCHQTESEVTSVSNRVNCEKCLLGKLKGLGSLASLIQMKWEYVRRRQILKLLVGLGKCQVISSATTSSHMIYLKCTSILRGGNDCNCLSSTSCEFEFKGEEIPGDSLAYECAEVFYSMGWYISKALYSSETRNVHHVTSLVKMSHAVTLLKHAYVLSHEIPLLFQKVSKLLALMYLVSASRENLSFPRFSGNVHSENYWAAYFHQAAVGNHYNLQLLSAIREKYNSPIFSEVQGSACGIGMTEKMHTLLSIVPQSITEIESLIANFFESLPDSAVVCVSFLGKSYVSLLDGLMHYSSSVHGLILLSRLSADSQPVVIVMPLTSLLEDCQTSFSDSINGEIDSCKEWRSPWGTNALIDDVAPLFKSILRENYLSSSSFPEEDTEKNRQLWWSQRYSLDGCLQNLVREMEEFWFDQWKYLLLGRLIDAESLIPAMKELMQNIQERFEIDVNKSVLEMVMSGTKSTNLEKERVPMVFLEKGCYICSDKNCGKERCSSGLDDACAETDYILGSVFAVANRHEVEYCTRREPVVLVLDSNVQMLPWESMPIMREQEVYRVPSVASIIVALQRRSALEKASKLSARFPLIDPLDSFYLLNPSGDLSCTQAEFQDWFRSQNIQGISGVVPSMADWSAALQNHDLFLYFGHGSGAQYMPPEKVKKLESCAATLLMGCSSGTLNLNGCYSPVGTPLAYILAGAPIVIANLWEVTDRDIDRFAKAMLKSFMEERSMSSTDCIQCSLMAEEFESMTMNENLGNPKRGRRKKKPTKTTPEVAAPVCYGVPTGIRKKRET